MPLTPIKTPYLREQALIRLRDAIVSGLLAPGAPIVIDDLAEALGLSSMPVREAVKRLVADALIEELPRRAHRVAPLTRDSALGILEVTETLMAKAYEIGVPALEDEDIAAMRAALEAAGRHAAAGDLIAVLADVHAMHEVVYRATGNPEFERALSPLGPRFDRVLHIWYTDSILQAATSYRRDLVEALEAGRREDAVEIMRQAWRRFRDVIASRPDGEEEV
ncbi:MAG: GntR family transcriptional regulator [Gaiella sp.]